MLDIKKAHEGDLVELIEDLPQYHLNRGSRGFVIEAFSEPSEAYDIEFEDENGEFLGFAYSVKPFQIENITAIAKEIFERGIESLESGNELEAEKQFRQAIALVPTYIGILHNSIVRSFENSDDWQRAISAMKLVVRVSPDYEIARRNLAIAFQKFGIQKAAVDDNEAALELFGLALSAAPPEEIIADIKNSIAAVFTSLGTKAYQNKELLASLRFMEHAHIVNPNEKTRHNLAIAYVHLAYGCLEEGRFGEAVLAFERSQHTGLLTMELLNDYGVALASLKRFEEAVFAFERALEIGPESDTIKVNLELAKRDNDIGLNTNRVNIEFDPLPRIQPQTYQTAA